MKRQDTLAKLHGYICSDGCICTFKCKDLHGKKIRTRRRLRTRFYSGDKELIEDFVNSVKECFPKVKSIRYYPKRFEVEIRNHTLTKEILSLGKVWSHNWEFPDNLTPEQRILWIRAFADCDGTVQNRKYDRFIAIDSVNLNGLKSIAEELKIMDIKSKIYSVMKGSSFRLKIFGKENLVRFNSFIGFSHLIKHQKLNEAIASYIYK